MYPARHVDAHPVGRSRKASRPRPQTAGQPAPRRRVHRAASRRTAPPPAAAASGIRLPAVSAASAAIHCSRCSRIRPRTDWFPRRREPPRRDKMGIQRPIPAAIPHNNCLPWSIFLLLESLRSILCRPRKIGALLAVHRLLPLLQQPVNRQNGAFPKSIHNPLWIIHFWRPLLACARKVHLL